MAVPPEGLMSEERRQFIKSSAAALAAGATGASVHAGAWAAGSDAPEKKEVRVGFIPLTDCASVVMASVLKFDEKHGVRIVPSKEASWAGVRDKLVSGELDMAHVLVGLVYGVHLGIGGPKKDMAVLMTLNNNGQGITLSRSLADRGAADLEGLARRVLAGKGAEGVAAKEAAREGARGAAREGELTFAQTFPTGTHAMWLYYWLASAGIHPFADTRVVTVPPPQMVANMRAGAVHGFSVGEPWNHRALIDGVGISAATSQDVWPDHPEKVLGTTGEFVQKHPNTCRAVVSAVLEASRWIDAGARNQRKMAETIAAREFVNTSVEAISPRILGHYQNGLGRTWADPHHLRFFADGAVNYPYLSDGMWFLTQHKRWGLLKDHPDYLGVARAVNQVDLYAQAASALGVSLPKEPMRASRLIDGVVWDGRDPRGYADRFAIGAAQAARSGHGAAGLPFA
ncbi:MAG: ABC transporter substrate-binding protein [Rubrivivax sp.]|nr:ABC transporter substrate-binding protein [Rubrivivax sp.]